MYLFFKRCLDFFTALVSLILLFPVFLTISFLIKISSKGPVFFKQRRLGKKGRVFKIIKFRSMVVNAEKQGAGLFNFKDDPRVTKIGKFLRKTSLDELPQLINILKGDMSLIGPRPPVEYELGEFETLNSKYKKRFLVRPGMSGLAQTVGRNELPWHEKIIYDNQYVDLVKSGKGFQTDIKIFFKTIGQIVKRKDIYETKIDENLEDAEAARIAEMKEIELAHASDEE